MDHRCAALALCAAALLAGIVACRPDQRGSTARDSAGIRIFEVELDSLLTQRAVLAASPVVRIGTAARDPAYQLHSVAGAAVLGDGSIVVALGSPPELRLYSADGTHLESVALHGQGPGELGRISVLRRLEGDSLLIAGSPSLVLLRDAQLRPVAQFASGAGTLSGADRSGNIVTVTQRLRSSPADSFWYEHALRIVDRDGATVDSVPLPHTLAQSIPAGAVTGYLFQSAPLVDMRDATLLYSRPNNFSAELQLWHALAPTTIMRIGGAERPVTREFFEQYVNELIEAAPPSTRELNQRLLVQLPYADSISAFSAVRMGADGSIWALRNEPLPSVRQQLWYHFAPDGAPLGTMHPGDGRQVLEFLEDAVLLLERDAQDVESVALYRTSGGDSAPR